MLVIETFACVLLGVVWLLLNLLRRVRDLEAQVALWSETLDGETHRINVLEEQLQELRSAAGNSTVKAQALGVEEPAQTESWRDHRRRYLSSSISECSDPDLWMFFQHGTSSSDEDPALYDQLRDGLEQHQQGLREG